MEEIVTFEAGWVGTAYGAFAAPVDYAPGADDEIEVEVASRGGTQNLAFIWAAAQALKHEPPDMMLLITKEGLRCRARIVDVQLGETCRIRVRPFDNPLEVAPG